MVEVEGKHNKTSSTQKSTRGKNYFVCPVHTRRSSLSRCLTAFRTRATPANAGVRLAFSQWQVELSRSPQLSPPYLPPQTPPFAHRRPVHRGDHALLTIGSLKAMEGGSWNSGDTAKRTGRNSH
jgi:hypothetical protein